MATIANGISQPVCQNCSTSTTPLWRRDESGAVLCNACGLFLKLHGHSRPPSLKTDVIKSRNRVKTHGLQGQKRKTFEGGLPASHASQAQQIAQRATQNGQDHTDSPLSRTNTPGFHHSSNIAPQHMFDGVTLSDHAFPPTSGPYHQPSPGSSSSNDPRHLEAPLNYEALLQQNATMKTRIAELEVINGFIEQYQKEGQAQPQAPQAEMIPQDSEQDVRRQLEEAKRREEELKLHVEELERELAELKGEQPPAKRRRGEGGAASEYPEPTSLN